MAVVVFRPRFEQSHVKGLMTQRFGEGTEGRVWAVCSCGWSGRRHNGPIPQGVREAERDWKAHRGLN